MMQILRGIVRWIFACDVIDEVALLAKSERSRSYVTEERAKRHWQDPQKQSNMNFRQALSFAQLFLLEIEDGFLAFNFVA